MDNETEFESLFPIAVDVEKGKSYTWCGCGNTNTPPFCDKQCCGEKAVTVHADLNEQVYFCQCKQTKNPPWCDGSHAKILLEILKRKVPSHDR